MHDAREKIDLDARSLAWGAASIAGGIGFALAVGYAVYRHFQAPPPGAPMTIAQPLLETAPQADRAAYEAEKYRQLHRTEWVDRSRGIARIPVEDAMRILAARQEGKR